MNASLSRSVVVCGSLLLIAAMGVNSWAQEGVKDILTDDPLGRGPQQITLAEGLRGYTRDAAWFTREEHERGQIKIGYLADVVILDRDPFELEARSIRETKAALTIVDGKVVYSDGSL